MNIFLVNPNPEICAQALDDLRLNKMILETGQMLSTAFRHWVDPKALDDAYVQANLYKQTHVNHPCNVWLRENISNFYWLVDYFQALQDERFYRFGKTHLTWEKLMPIFERYHYDEYLTPYFTFDCSNVANLNITKFERYQLCLINKWFNDKRAPTWTKRGKPCWHGDNQ